MRTALALGLLLLLSTCRDAAHASGTALLVTVELGGLAPDQLSYRGFDLATDAGVFGPALEPAKPAPVPDLSVVRVLLRDDLAGQQVEVTIEASSGGLPLGEGVARVTIALGVETALVVHLASPTAACVGCVSGLRCLSATAAFCGANGSVCVTCDLQSTDSCAADGRCACGLGPPCTPSVGGDHCSAGACRCGPGSACGAGLECLAGACQCTPASCAGCCSGGVCMPGSTRSRCGAGGGACLDCGATSCNGGRCVSPVCDATTCPTGCCNGAVCMPGRDPQSCGGGGHACVTCSGGSCSTLGVCTGCTSACSGCCSGGACSQGNDSASCGVGGLTCRDCGNGTCSAGACVAGCDATTCPTGCCSGNVCQPGVNRQACGTAGAHCAQCNGNRQCVAQRCS